MYIKATQQVALCAYLCMFAHMHTCAHAHMCTCVHVHMLALCAPACAHVPPPLWLCAHRCYYRRLVYVLLRRVRLYQRCLQFNHHVHQLYMQQQPQQQQPQQLQPQQLQPQQLQPQQQGCSVSTCVRSLRLVCDELFAHLTTQRGRGACTDRLLEVSRGDAVLLYVLLLLLLLLLWLLLMLLLLLCGCSVCAGVAVRLVICVVFCEVVCL